MTQLHNRIYVLIGSSPSIQVYDSLTFTRLKDVPVTSSSRRICVEDMAASPLHNCIYIYDRGASCVWRISVADDGHVTTRWLRAKWEEPDHYVGTLSVTSRGCTAFS